MNKTVAIYGVFGLFVLLQLIAIAMIGKHAKDIIMYVVILDLVILLFLIILDPFGLFCILLAWFPFSFGILKFELSVITFTPYTMGMILLTFLGVYLRVAKGRRYNITMTDIIMFFLCCTFLLSTLLSKDINQSGFFAFHALFVPAISYFCVKNMVLNEKQYLQAFIFLVAGVILFALLAISPFGRSFSEGRLLVFDLPVISASAIFIWVIVTSFILNWNKKIYERIFLGFVFVGFLRTLSKGYFVILLIAPFISGIVKKGKASQLMIYFLVLSLIFSLILAVSSTSFKYVDVDNQEDQSVERVLKAEHWVSSFVSRGRYYLDGFKNVTNNPILGVGAYRGESGVVRHNFHVEWMEYGGFSMYFLYCMLFITHFKSMGPYARYDKYIRANLVTIFIFILNGLFNSFTVGSTPVMTFILFGFNEARRRMYLRKELVEPDRI